MDNELIQAIREVVREEIAPLKITVNGLQTAVNGLETTVGGLETSVGSLETTVGGMQADIMAIRIDIENSIKPDIKRLADGHNSLAEKMDRMETKLDDTYDEVKAVGTIQNVMVHQLEQQGIIHLADTIE